jgi:hypothetical protein
VAIPYGIHVVGTESMWNFAIPYGFHVVCMNSMWSIWKPYGMWGHSKVLINVLKSRNLLREIFSDAAVRVGPVLTRFLRTENRT